MRYEGDIYRPPSEAYSLLVQATIGCSHNGCTFCSMFKAKKFRVRPLEDVLEDFREARKTYRRIDRIFLCDGDAMCLSNNKLLPILEEIAGLFPECERVGIYARANDILRKTPEELKALKDAGLGIAYIGAESGSPEVLKRINKGSTREEIIEGVKKSEEAGIKTSVTFISGMGGEELWEDHAVQTGTMIKEMGASYVGLLTLMLDPITQIWKDIEEGRFKLLSPEMVLKETHLLLENTRGCKPLVFRSNHASNYISLKGNLPDDLDSMLEKLEMAMEDHGMLKDERFRML